MAKATTSEVIETFLRVWDYRYDDIDRVESYEPDPRALTAYAPRLVGTAGTPEQEKQRAWMAADWLVRDYTPIWLRAAGYNSHADDLTSMPELGPDADLAALQQRLNSARDAVWAEPEYDWELAWDEAISDRSAGHAAWAAAAGLADVSGLWTAIHSAWGTASDAAKILNDDSGHGPWDSDPGSIDYTIKTCQRSAHRLVERMIAVTDGAMDLLALRGIIPPPPGYRIENGQVVAA